MKPDALKPGIDIVGKMALCHRISCSHILCAYWLHPLLALEENDFTNIKYVH